MAEASGKRQAEITRLGGAVRAVAPLHRYFEALFDRAPVMMHIIDRAGTLLGANRRWLRRLGYRRQEVLGREIVDFLKEESRVRAANEGLPVFWRTGSARGIERQFVRKDGQVVDVLLDAEIILCDYGTWRNCALATLCDSHDRMQRHQALSTIDALQQVCRADRHIEAALYSVGSPTPYASTPAVPQRAEGGLAMDMAVEGLGRLLELMEDISANLRALVRIHDDWMGARVEQQGELLLVMKDIVTGISELTDAIATTWGPAE